MKNYIIKASETKLDFNANNLKKAKEMFNKQFREVIYLDKNNNIKKDLILDENILYLIKDIKGVKKSIDGKAHLYAKLYVINKSLDELKALGVIKDYKIIAPQYADTIVTKKVDNNKYKLYFQFNFADEVFYLSVSFENKLPKEWYFKLKQYLNYFKKSNSKKGYSKGEFYLIKDLKEIA